MSVKNIPTPQRAIRTKYRTTGRENEEKLDMKKLRKLTN